MRLLITTILGCLITFTSANAQNCTAAPSCADLGYKQTQDQCKNKGGASKCPFGDFWSCDTKSHSHITCDSLGYKEKASDCPGKYIRCPFDSSKVMCLPETHSAGDLKYSWSTKDHDGWLLCNGRSFSKVEYPDLYTVLGSENLPSYSGYFLKGAAASGTSTFKTAQAASLPNIKGSIGLVSDNAGVATGGVDGKLFTGSGTGNVYDHGDSGGKGYFMTVTFDASQYSSIYKDSTTTVTPKNYSANIFIYAGEHQGFTCDAGQFLLNDDTCSEASNSNKDKILGVVYSTTKATVNGNTNCFVVKYAMGQDLIERSAFTTTCVGTAPAADVETLEAVFGLANGNYSYANLDDSRKYFACEDVNSYYCYIGSNNSIDYDYYTCTSSGCSGESACPTPIDGYIPCTACNTTSFGCTKEPSNCSDKCTKPSGMINAKCSFEIDTTCKYETGDYNPNCSSVKNTHGYYVRTYTKTICGMKNN